jgi:hypothetical protein
MSLNTAIKNVQNAVASKSLVSWMTHFLVQDRMIVGTNGALSAAAAFAMEGSFVVHAETFSKSVALLGDNLQSVFSENTVVLSSARKKVTVQLLSSNAFSFALPDGDWKPCPANIITTLRRAQPFISEDASVLWANGVFFDAGFAYATNNVCVFRAVSQCFDHPILVPVSCVEYLVNRGEQPEEYAIKIPPGAKEPSQIAFRFRDGSWVNATLFLAKPPEALARIAAFEDADLPAVDLALKSAIAAAAMFSDGTLVIRNRQIVAGRDPASFEEVVDYETDKETIWDVKNMAKVMKEATALDINRWPAPALWTGVDCRGVIMGRTG